MPRHDQKAYTTVTVLMPHALVRAVQRYAAIHQCTVSELICAGVKVLLAAGETGEEIPKVFPGTPGKRRAKTL